MTPSMSRKGNCYDNPPMESFWGTLKNELVHHRVLSQVFFSARFRYALSPNGKKVEERWDDQF